MMDTNDRATATLHPTPGPLDDARRGDLVYAGELVVFERLEGVKRLREHAERMIRAAFGALPPETAQFALAPEPYLALTSDLLAAFERHPETRRLFCAALAETGLDLASTYADRLRLRIVPHGTSHLGGRITTTGAHRDTWGSALPQQTNWWAPVYRTPASRSIAFYPYYWSRPISNTSGSWSFAELKSRHRRHEPYPNIPEPDEPVDDAYESRAVIEPGDLLAFSGAQLHATVPNASGAARFSLETRTVYLPDVLEGRGAPNVDGASSAVMYRWFRHVLSRQPLAEAIPGQPPDTRPRPGGRDIP